MTERNELWQPGYPIDHRGERVRSRDAARPYGDDEYRAARIVARATGAQVVLQDDNRGARTPDLFITHSDGRTGVGEVVTVTNQDRAAESRASANGRLDLHCNRLRWQWWVTAPPHVDRRQLRAPLLDVLAEMEAANERPPMHVAIDPAHAGPVLLKLWALGITAASADDEPGVHRGRVRWQPEGIGGSPDVDLDGFRRWLDGFLGSPLARRKIGKLTAVGGNVERHLVVGVSWSAPWAAVRLLDRDVYALPTQAPALPTGLTNLWIWGCESPSRALAWWPERGWFDVQTRWVTQ